MNVNSRLGLLVLGLLPILQLLSAKAVVQEGVMPGRSLELTTAVRATEVLRVTLRRISWEGREFDAKDGVRVLMSVIRDSAREDQLRARAAHRLGTLGVQLRGEDCVSELIELYRKDLSNDMRHTILVCLVNSEDQRALPLLMEAAASEHVPFLRILGAGGLARWNVRSGIAVLIDLFSLDEVGPRGALGWEAVILFESQSRRKQWGLPEALMKRDDPAMARLSDHQLRRELQRRCREWFEQNKDRFPDWKAGDPLPEVGKEHRDPRADK